MPYAKRRRGKKIEVYNKDSGKVMGTFSSDAKADAQLAALAVNVTDANKHAGSHDAITKDHLQAIHNHAADMGADCSEDNMKHGAIHGKVEPEKVQAIHDHSSDMGARHGPEQDPVEMYEAGKHYKSLKDYGMDAMPMMAGEAMDNPPDDIRSAASAIMSLSYLLEAEDEEPDDCKLICDTIGMLMKFIQSEMDEMDAGEDPDDVAQKHFIQVLDKPINLSYIKSLGKLWPDGKAPEFVAVKSIGVDMIKHYPFIWGGKNITDVELEYFRRPGEDGTDLWDQVHTRDYHPPLTWDHAQDEEFQKKNINPVIGYTVEFGDDDLGRWAISKLDRSHQYRKMIDGLIERGVLGSSSDTAPQYIERERTGKSTFIKTWPWFATALTDVPAEPRQVATLEFYKSIGIKLPETDAKARWEWEQSRMSLAKSKIFTF